MLLEPSAISSIKHCDQFHWKAKSKCQTFVLQQPLMKGQNSIPNIYFAFQTWVLHPGFCLQRLLFCFWYLNWSFPDISISLSEFLIMLLIPKHNHQSNYVLADSMHSSKTCVDKYVWRTSQTSGTLNLLASIIFVTLSFLLFICTVVLNT